MRGHNIKYYVNHMKIYLPHMKMYLPPPDPHPTLHLIRNDSSSCYWQPNQPVLTTGSTVQFFFLWSWWIEGTPRSQSFTKTGRQNWAPQTPYTMINFGWFVDLGLTALSDNISVYIGPSPREREKEKRNERWEKKCPNNPHPHLLQAQ